ncbi:MAG: hypothetical protein KC910_23940 [Candidatus Eremiobacteraeota bacterium]|nr:hypothetical protein [Candidatus Eremiobacteraeota bacterium]
MGSLFSKKDRGRVGVDFGPGEVRLVWVEGDQILALDRRSCDDSNLAESLQAAVAAAEVPKNTPATIFFSARYNCILDKRRPVELDGLSPQQQLQAVRYDAERYVPYNLDEAHLSFRVLAKQDHETLVAVDAVAREERQEAASLLRAAGLRPQSYETRLREALTNLVRRFYPGCPDGFCVFHVDGPWVRCLGCPAGYHLAGQISGFDQRDDYLATIDRNVLFQQSKKIPVEAVYLTGSAAHDAIAQAAQEEVGIPCSAVRLRWNDQTHDPAFTLATALALLKPEPGLSFD